MLTKNIKLNIMYFGMLLIVANECSLLVINYIVNLELERYWGFLFN